MLSTLPLGGDWEWKEQRPVIDQLNYGSNSYNAVQRRHQCTIYDRVWLLFLNHLPVLAMMVL